MANSKPELRADDGTPLEIKEGVVLDRDGNEISAPKNGGDDSNHHSWSSHLPRVRVVRVNGLLAPLLFSALLIVLFTAGFTIFATAVAFFICLWIIRYLLRSILELLGVRRR